MKREFFEGIVHNMPMGKEQSAAYRREVGWRMQLTRMALGMKQKALSLSIGEAPNTWNQYEKGKRLIDPVTLGQWCDKAGLTLEWIYLGKKNKLDHELVLKIEALENKLGPKPPSDASLVMQKAAR